MLINSHEQKQHFETSLQNEKIEEKDDEILVGAEIIPTKVVSESILLTLLSPENEIRRSNEDDVVGTFIDASFINLRVIIEMILSFIFFFFSFFSL